MEQCVICTYKTYLYELPCGHRLCLSCVKANDEGLCPFCRQEIPEKILEAPEKTRTIGSDLFKSLPNIVWLYEARNVGWWTFNYEHQHELEDAYRKNPDGICSLLICGSVIEVDFSRMMQSNTATNAVRAVKRLPKDQLDTILVKGVAGMK